jgi:hypothetical protein
VADPDGRLISGLSVLDADSRQSLATAVNRRKVVIESWSLSNGE